MKTISNDIINEIEIKKSKFITLLYFIDNLDEIEHKINKVKDLYKNATHYCYAYILDTLERISDDKEPQGTAGIPILNVLKKNDLNHILVIVVRYFGGIKLGASGLVRAYSNSISIALEKTSIVKIDYGYQIEITTTYNKQKQLDRLLLNSSIISRSFGSEVIVLANVSKEVLNVLDNHSFSYIKVKKITIKEDRIN